MTDETGIPTPDDSTPAGAEHPFEPSPTDDSTPAGAEHPSEPSSANDSTRADRESLHPSGAPAADPDAGPTSPAERGR